MYKIGDFALITRVSIKLLRYYDEIGLLKPASVDRFTSYRYYTLDQLPRLHRIMAFKEMGFSLAEISSLIDNDLSSTEMDRLIQSKKEALYAERDLLESRLERLDLWSKRIAFEETVPDYEITLKPFDPSRLPSLPPLEDKPIVLPLSTRGALPENVLLPVPSLPQPEWVAATIHEGDDAGLVNAYIALDRWIKENGYQIAGVPQEITLHMDEAHPVNNRTEVQIPISKQ